MFQENWKIVSAESHETVKNGKGFFPITYSDDPDILWCAAGAVGTPFEGFGE
jgi:hypothetical protein